MDKKRLVEKAELHLHVLCSEIGERRVGSEANRKSTFYVESILKEVGWMTEVTQLSVIDWLSDGAMLKCDGRHFEVYSSHYSLGCAVVGELVAIDTVARLEREAIEDKIVLLHGEIASQQIAPKNFPFWNPDEHQYLISLLEKGNPRALVCATERNSAVAGGVYPFPLFEDGDFNIPSVYMKDTEGVTLLSYTGKTVELISKAKRIPETAFNVLARRGKPQGKKRIVITAHIDSKIGTPGAIDNATGVTVLLLLAELLKECNTDYSLELVFFNGEDYYGAPGQITYLKQNEGKMEEIALNINIDGAGYLEGKSCFSPFNLPEDMLDLLHEVLWEASDLVEGKPWYQGDHSVFLQQGCPAIAVSSSWFIDNMDNQDITHTSKDNLSIVNYERVVECAQGIAALIEKL